MMGRRETFLLSALIASPLLGWLAYDWGVALPDGTVATFVGREQCVGCHQEQAKAFADSDHDKSMDVANEKTVLGDFNEAELEYHGIRARFFRKGTRFMVHTEGPTGKMEDFEVKYVFGHDPLQQYMVEFDRPADLPQEQVSRVQVLRECWDTKRKKWFYLDPPDVAEKLAPDDDLHWTGIGQRWQTMCAECHSTNLSRNFDPRDNCYRTTFSEIDVSCEACHGPGSTHVKLAKEKTFFWDRRLGMGLTKLKGADPEPQVQTCAHCHSRRQVLVDAPGGHQFWMNHDLEKLHGAIYFDDGQIKDEVYEYGSFLQSKMYHKGIRCSDCHDPHSLKMKAPGNQVCTSCHQHPPGKYDTPAHHHHAPGTPGSMCVDCHMPSRTYMKVDPRRDHSIRVPRPDLSVKLGTPNACTGCHLKSEHLPAEIRDRLREYADWQQLSEEVPQVKTELQRADQWCDGACAKWYGSNRKLEPHFAEALSKFRRGEEGGAESLYHDLISSPLQPAIARATALEELARQGASLGLKEFAALSKSEHPLIRAAAIDVVRPRDPSNPVAEIRSIGPLLLDRERLVRIRAVQGLLRISGGDQNALRQGLTAEQHKNLAPALKELEASLMVTNDRAGAHLSWGSVLELQGDWQGAIQAYETAMRIEPRTSGPRSNLANILDNLRSQVTPEQSKILGEKVLELRKSELALFERDARLAPKIPELQFRVGQMRYLVGRGKDAVAPIQEAIRMRPDDIDFRYFLMLLWEKLGETENATMEREKIRKLQEKRR